MWRGRAAGQDALDRCRMNIIPAALSPAPARLRRMAAASASRSFRRLPSSLAAASSILRKNACADRAVVLAACKSSVRKTQRGAGSGFARYRRALIGSVASGRKRPCSAGINAASAKPALSERQPPAASPRIMALAAGASAFRARWRSRRSDSINAKNSHQRYGIGGSGAAHLRQRSGIGFDGENDSSGSQRSGGIAQRQR